MALRILSKRIRFNRFIGVVTHRLNNEGVLFDFPKPQTITLKFVNRGFSDQTKEDPTIASYEEVKDLPNHKEKMLIDVREPQELIDTGVIPTSINIPLKQVKEVLSKDFPNEVFSLKYKREKPSLETPLIFMCKIGIRSQTASDICLKQLGYKNVKNYKGSWLDWAEREGLNK